MKIAIYARVSKGDLNPENQKRQLIEHAVYKGWEYEVFEEIESTRKTRPIKEKILQSLRDGKIDGILIYKLDRWARSLQELIMNVKEVTDRGKQFIVLTQPFDTTSSSGMLMMQILGAFAEFEREIIRERTMAGLERAKSQGKKLGRPKKAASAPLPDISKVRELLLKNYTTRQIAKELKTNRYRVEKAIEIAQKEYPPAVSPFSTQEMSG